MSHKYHKPTNYLPIDYFRKREDWSSRVVHNRRIVQKPLHITVSPNTMTFGTVQAGTVSLKQTATVTNTGYKPVPILAVRGVGDFLITHNAPEELAPGASFEISISFAPVRNGIATGGVYVDSGDAAGTEFISFLGLGSGGGVDPEPPEDLELDEMILELWNFIVRATGSNATQAGIPMLITTEGLVKNNMFEGGALGGYTADGAASSEGIALLMRGIAEVWELDEDPEKIQYIEFLYDALCKYFFRGEVPTSDPNQHWDHTWLINAGPRFNVLGPLYYIEEDTDVEGPRLRTSPSSLSFGSVGLGQTVTRTLTLTNYGTEILTISSMTADAPYSIGSYPSSILPGGSAQVSVAYSPTTTGQDSGNVRISSNAPNSSVSVSVLGSGRDETPIAELSWLSTSGSKIYDEQGRQVILKSFNWYGMEGIIMPHALWERAYKTVTVGGVTYEGILDQMAAAGFNCMRFPICEDLTWPGRKIYGNNTINATKNPDLLITPATGAATAENIIPSIQIMDKIVDKCEELGIRIILDMHALSLNTDNTTSTGGLWYTTPTPTSPGGSTGAFAEPRNEEQWIAAWEFLAERYKDRPIVCGFDLINEPYNGTWDDNPLTGLPAAYERCAERVHAINPELLILCGGPGGMLEFPNGENWGAIWGGNLTGVRTRPVVLSTPNKVVYTPHEYANMGAGSGPPWLFTPGFPGNLDYVWDYLWGYIAKEEIAPLFLGEFGGNFSPGQRIQHEWIAALREYLIATEQSWAWWAFTPDLVDPNGLQGLVRTNLTDLDATTLSGLQELIDFTPDGPVLTGYQRTLPSGDIRVTPDGGVRYSP